MEEPKTSFKTREVYDLIRRQYRALKKEHEDLFAEKFHLQRQLISPQRAIFMAKNIFVRGDYKRLREDIRRYKKEEQRLASKLLAYAKEEKEFQMRDWSVFPRSTFLQAQYYLTKQRTLLEIEKNHLDQIKFSLQKKEDESEALCRQFEAKKKIKEIILRLNHSQDQMKALENRIACDKVNTRYRVTGSDTLSNNNAASLIADAILFEPQAVQLVALLDGNFLEMEKDWEMMSEFDKDELIRRKIIREL